MEEERDDPPDWADEIAREFSHASLQRFVRDNFGLYHPPGDYKAIRAENLRRTEISRRTVKVP